MNAIRRVCETTHMVALAVWLGGLIMVGIAAAVLFPTLKNFDVKVPHYESYTGEHWMLAAGQVGQRMFQGNRYVQEGCAAVAVGSLAIGWYAGARTGRQFGRGLWVRIAALLLACAVLAFQAIRLTPRMDLHLRHYWTAALRGENEEAEKEKALFSADHPKATRVLGATAALVLVSLIGAGWQMSGRREESAN